MIFPEFSISIQKGKYRPCYASFLKKRTHKCYFGFKTIFGSALTQVHSKVYFLTKTTRDQIPHAPVKSGIPIKQVVNQFEIKNSERIHSDAAKRLIHQAESLGNLKNSIRIIRLRPCVTLSIQLVLYASFLKA